MTRMALGSPWSPNRNCAKGLVRSEMMTDCLEMWLKPRCFGTNDVIRAFRTEDIALRKLDFEMFYKVAMILFGRPDFIFRRNILTDVLMLRVGVLRMVCDAY